MAVVSTKVFFAGKMVILTALSYFTKGFAQQNLTLEGFFLEK